MSKSTITHSIEIELGWGKYDQDEFSALSTDGEEEYRYLKRLLNLLENKNIPVTFDVVGHLCLSECCGKHDCPTGYSRFGDDPGTSKKENPLFYAPKLIKMVDESPINHEICTHTFSHPDFEDITEREFVWEVKHGREKVKNMGINPSESLVVPYNRKIHHKTLSQLSIDSVRVSYPRYRGDLRSKWNMFSRVLGRKHPRGGVKYIDGVKYVFTSWEPSLTAPHLPSGQRKTHPAFTPIPIKLRKKIQFQYLKKSTKDAIEKGHDIHFWTHLYNLSNEVQFNIIESYFSWVENFVKNKDASIRTMEYA